MRVLLDQNVPNSVAQIFEANGHEVIYLRDILPVDSPDPLVATVSEVEGAVLVSHDGDFKNIAPRIPLGQRQRFRKLSRIHLQCEGPQAATRVEKAMAFIEKELEIAQNSNDPRMILTIGKNFIKTLR